MINDYVPVMFSTPEDCKEAVIHFVHDVHYGSKEFDIGAWERVKREIDQPGHYAVFVGDLMENATIGSKSDIYYQTCPPLEQRDWVVDQFRDLKDHIIGVTDGNHERNRSTKACGLFPIYDACLLAGLENYYRPHFLMIDIGVGRRIKSGTIAQKQNHYAIFAVHRAKDIKSVCSCDYIDGIDVFAFGHDHEPKSHPRGRLSYNPINKNLTHKTVRVVNCGSFLGYNGYAVDSAYRPNAVANYTVHLCGTEKKTWVVES